jgi:predicted enzyme related to lactoylglutathione lyase
MAHAIGLGGAFLRSQDPDALYAWYEKHLHLERKNGCFMFPAGAQRGDAVVAFFSRDNDYWPASQPAMLNLQVDDLDAILRDLQAAGVAVDPKRDDYGFGQFGWITDPEGNRVELWEPSKSE